MPLKWPSLPDNGSITEKNGEDRLESIYFMYLSRGQFRREYVYPNLLDPTNFSGPNANPGFPRDVGETPGFFREITGLEEKPGFFPICWKFRLMITDDLEE